VVVTDLGIKKESGFLMDNEEIEKVLQKNKGGI